MASGLKLATLVAISFLFSLYSLDLAPADFHIFRSISNALRDVSFTNGAELRAWFADIFESKAGYIYPRGIKKLIERWEEIVCKHGEYIDE